MTATHLPLPKLHVGTLCKADIFDEKENYIGSIYEADSSGFDPDMAALIVRSVNSHDQLVEALECALKFIENSCELYDRESVRKGYKVDHENSAYSGHIALLKTRAALAAAKGGRA